MGNWKVILVEPAQTIITQLGQFIGKAILVVIILIAGWIVSNAIKAVVTRVLRAVKVDALSENIKLDDLLAKGGISFSLSELIGVIGYWLGILVTLVVAINSIGLTVAADLLNRVILYIPNIIAAIFILILAMFTGTLLSGITQTAASNAGLSQAKLLGKIVYTVVLVFAVVIALEQLNIGGRAVEMIVGVTLASIGLAVAISFGLGCKDIAGRYISELIENIKSKK